MNPRVHVGRFHQRVPHGLHAVALEHRRPVLSLDAALGHALALILDRFGHVRPQLHAQLDNLGPRLARRGGDPTRERG